MGFTRINAVEWECDGCGTTTLEPMPEGASETAVSQTIPENWMRGRIVKGFLEANYVVDKVACTSKAAKNVLEAAAENAGKPTENSEGAGA